MREDDAFLGGGEFSVGRGDGNWTGGFGKE